VHYIYRKQLEEADLIVINKRDLLDDKQSAQLSGKLVEEFPRAEIVAVSARNGDGLAPWFARVMSVDQSARQAMEVDYELYGQGEALLGWLNCAVKISSPDEFDGNAMLHALARRMQELLNAADAEVAHLKMTFSPDEGLGEIGVINLVRNDFVPELSQELPDAVRSGELIINCRAEAAPEKLLASVQEALADGGREQPGLSLRLEHSEHFRPGQPKPTHRIAVINE
jgi:G3E family GTPase